MQLQLEHRRHKRIEISRPVELWEPSELQDGAGAIAGRTRNISNEGISAHFEQNLDVGDLRPLLMHLEEDAPPVSKQARVVWCAPSDRGSGMDVGLELVAPGAAKPPHPDGVEDTLRPSTTGAREQAALTPDEPDATHSHLLEAGQLVTLKGENGDVLMGRILSSQVGKTLGSVTVELQLEPRPTESFQTLWKQAAAMLAALTVLGDYAKRTCAFAVDLLRKSPPPMEGSDSFWDKARLSARGLRKSAWVAAVNGFHKVAVFAGKILGSRRNKRRPFRAPFKD